MRRRKILIALVACVIATTNSGSAYGTKVVWASGCTGQWTVGAAPSLPAGTTSALLGVAAVTATDVWAVGYKNSGAKTLIEHFDGTAWSVVPSPNIAGALRAITAPSATDAWAVGSNASGASLTEHWDGAVWKQIPSPGLVPLDGVSGNSANDVWAVGGRDFGGSALTQHWDGVAWAILPVPAAAHRETLHAVTVVSGNDVWAVGNQAAHILHWQGRSWRLVPGPVQNSFLFGLAAVSATDIWAVGQIPIGAGSTLVEHWNGLAWSQVSAPSGFRAALHGVTVIAPHWVIAVGHVNLNLQSQVRTLVLSWNGSNWTKVFSPNPNIHFDQLMAVSGVRDGSGSVWAVGVMSGRFGANPKQLIEERCR